MSETSVSDPSVSRHRVSDLCPSDLSARALTEDAEGCSRLRAVIASDPGYAARAQEIQSGRATPFATQALVPGSCAEAAPSAEGAACEAMSLPPVTPKPASLGRSPRSAGSRSPVLAAASSVLAIAFGSQGLAALTLRLPTP